MKLGFTEVKNPEFTPKLFTVQIDSEEDLNSLIEAFAIAQGSSNHRLKSLYEDIFNYLCKVKKDTGGGGRKPNKG